MTRLARLLTFLLVLTPVAGTAQEHYLITPQEEVISLKSGDTPSEILQARRMAHHPASPAACSDFFPFYIWNPWLVRGTWFAHHNEVMGQWYVAPVSGTIDTIFFSTQGIGGSGHDSLVFVRVHRSNISPAYGPGIRPGPFAPPCQPWGYWINSNDLDQGVSAFPDAATDTTWISTVRGSAVPSAPPIGEALWGAGGYPFYARPNSVNAVAMADLAPLEVEAGDLIFISVQLNWQGPGSENPGGESPMEFLFSENGVSTSDKYYPSRNWKFYEHLGAAASCTGADPDSIKPGWYARGGAYTGDSTEAALWDIWYSMTVTGNEPPLVVDQSPLPTTLSTAPRLLQAAIEDCLSLDPGLSGVGSASIRFEIDGVEQAPITMNYVGADTWEGSIPGQLPGTSVTGRVEATDLEGLKSNGPSFAYTIVPFGNSWYTLDTGYACTPYDISSTGTTLDTASFFLPPTAPASALALDDGTSGPYDLGANFILFNDWFRYAWIGVNGGIALSKTATDTLDVNSNGMFLAPGQPPWSFPSGRNPGRSSPGSAGQMPPMFIAPFWADLILVDEANTYGSIVIGNAGDTCLFITEWDEVAAVSFWGPECCITVRLVLNRCTGVVEYQYDIGTWLALERSLTGMQADSNAISGPHPGYVLLSRDGEPAEIAPADGRCIRMVPTVGLIAADGWNTASVSLASLDGDYSADHLFPGYKIWTYKYPGGYASLNDSLLPGQGFWIRSGSSERIGSVPGAFLPCVAVPVTDKWNLVGGPSCYVSTGSITATGGVISSSFYGYNNAYYKALALSPGRSYWVKMNGAGTLTMCCSDAPAIAPYAGGTLGGTDQNPPGMAGSLNAGTLVIRDASGKAQTLYLSTGTDERGHTVDPSVFELPPLPPEDLFDVRFASGRMLEVVGTTGTDGETSGPAPNELNVQVRGAHYPVTVDWDLTPLSGTAAGFTIAPAGADPSTAVTMAGSGTLTFDAVASGLLSIRLDGGLSVPSEFALGANYPNPFNPATTFTVDIPVATDVRVEVVDILGRNIAELLTGPQPAGSHRLSWDGLDHNGVQAPSGVYMIRLTSKDFTASRKALLVR